MNNYRFQFNIVTYKQGDKWYAYCAEPVPLSGDKTKVMPTISGKEMEEVRDKMADMISKVMRDSDEVYQWPMTMLSQKENE